MLGDLFGAMFARVFMPIKIVFIFNSKKIGYIILKILFIIIFSIPYFLFFALDLLVSSILLIPRYIPLLGMIFSLVCMLFDLFPIIFAFILISPDMIFCRRELKILYRIHLYEKELDGLEDLLIRDIITAEEYQRRSNQILGIQEE